MKIRSFLWFIFWALLLFGLVTFLLYRMQRQTAITGLVPPDARLVLYIPSSSHFNNQLKTAGWWASLQKSDYFGQLAHDLALLDTLFSLSGLGGQMQDVPSSVVMVETASGEPAFVFYAAVGRNFPYWDLHEKALPHFGQRFDLVRRKTAGHGAFLILDRRSGRQLSYSFAMGALVLSFNREVFEMAMALMGEKPDSALARKMNEHAASAADAVLFFNPARLSVHLSGLFTDEWAVSLNRTAGELDRWLALDVHLRANELMINGLLDDEPLFRLVDNEQRIGTDSLVSMLPVNTISAMAMFRTGSNGGETDGEEFTGLVVAGRAAVSGMAKPYLIFEPENPGRLSKLIFSRQPRMASVWGSDWTAPVDADGFAETIFSINGGLHSGRSFVTTNGSLFVFSSDLLMLRNYIETRSRQLVDSDLQNLREALPARSGLLLYHQISKAVGWLSEVAAGRLKYRLARDAAVFHGFGSLSVQMSRVNDKVYFNLLIRSNVNPAGQAVPLWSARLGAAGAAVPFMFADGAEGRVIAFDSAGWMYGFSSEGRQLWKKPVGGIPLGVPILINDPGLKRKYFLFNTASGIFLTDAAGNQAPGFPVRLPSRATAPLGYAPHDGPSIYVNCADRRTYAFNLSGKPVSSWNVPLLSDIASEPPATGPAAGSSYVLIPTMDGLVKITDDSGLERFRIKEPISKAEGAGIFLNRTNAKGIFITASPQGEFVYIGSGGLIKSPGPQRFSSSLYFHYEDFDADQSPDFMFADGRRFVIFDRFDRTIIEGMLRYEVRTKPYFLEGDGQPGLWCFSFAPQGSAAIVGPLTGLLNFGGLPEGENYGFGRTETSGALLLGAYEKDVLHLFRIN